MALPSDCAMAVTPPDFAFARRHTDAMRQASRISEGFAVFAVFAA